MDIWGINVYRGKSFGDLFSRWQQISSKPFYISEFGTDSFFTDSFDKDSEQRAVNCQGKEEQDKQAVFVCGLWKEIKSHLSASNPQEQCLGGLVFEFNDELWKVGSYHVGWNDIGLGGIVDYNGNDDIDNTNDDDTSYDEYNKEGFFVSGGHPDNAANEEYFGVVNSRRQPKEVFKKLSYYWWKDGIKEYVISGKVSDAQQKELSAARMKYRYNGKGMGFCLSSPAVSDGKVVFISSHDFNWSGIYCFGKEEIPVDTTAPITKISELPTIWSAQKMSLSLTVEDKGGSGVKETFYSVNGSEPNIVYAVPVVLTDGIYTIKYFSVDNAGNKEQIQTLPYQVKIDTGCPTIVNQTLSTQKVSVTFTAKVTDELSGVKEVYVEIESGTKKIPYSMKKTNGSSSIYTAVISAVSKEVKYRIAASDNAGNKSKTDVFYVKMAQLNNPPIAVIKVNCNSGKLPLKVSFSGKDSSDSDGKIVFYLWNFGDGRQSLEINPINTFYTSLWGARTYNVSLTVTDDRGANNTQQIKIKVYPKWYFWR